MTKVLVVPQLARAEKSIGGLFGLDRSRTLLHGFLLNGSAAIITAAAGYLSVRPLLFSYPTSGSAFPLAWLIVAAGLLVNLLLLLSCRFMMSFTEPLPRRLRSIIVTGALIIAAQMLWVALTAHILAAVTLPQIAQGFVMGLAHVLALCLVAPRLAALQQPYLDWLELDIA